MSLNSRVLKKCLSEIKKKFTLRDAFPWILSLISTFVSFKALEMTQRGQNLISRQFKAQMQLEDIQRLLRGTVVKKESGYNGYVDGVISLAIDPHEYPFTWEHYYLLTRNILSAPSTMISGEKDVSIINPANQFYIYYAKATVFVNAMKPEPSYFKLKSIVDDDKLTNCVYRYEGKDQNCRNFAKDLIRDLKLAANELIRGYYSAIGQNLSITPIDNENP